MQTPLIIAIVVIILIVFWAIGINNKLVRLRTKVEESFSTITTYLKARADLIVNSAKTVKKYSDHEQETFENIAKARANVSTAKTPAEVQVAEKEVEKGLGRLIAVAENYPELKADQNYLTLQKQLEEQEETIAAARTAYNSNVRKYETSRSVFPANVIASILKFNKKEYFKVENREQIEKAPDLGFDD